MQLLWIIDGAGCTNVTSLVPNFVFLLLVSSKQCFVSLFLRLIPISAIRQPSTFAFVFPVTAESAIPSVAQPDHSVLVEMASLGYQILGEGASIQLLFFFGSCVEAILVPSLLLVLDRSQGVVQQTKQPKELEIHSSADLVAFCCWSQVVWITGIL